MFIITRKRAEYRRFFILVCSLREEQGFKTFAPQCSLTASALNETRLTIRVPQPRHKFELLGYLVKLSRGKQLLETTIRTPRPVILSRIRPTGVAA